MEAAASPFAGDPWWRWLLAAGADHEAARFLAAQTGPEVGKWTVGLTPRQRVLPALESLRMSSH